jgi:hypothetical protein
MDRVEVSRLMIGICHMQVCAVADATDEEILAVCNTQNPSGTTAGWVEVVRDDKEYPQLNPGPCAHHPERLHILVSC